MCQEHNKETIQKVGLQSYFDLPFYDFILSIYIAVYFIIMSSEMHLPSVVSNITKDVSILHFKMPWMLDKSDKGNQAYYNISSSSSRIKYGGCSPLILIIQYWIKHQMIEVILTFYQCNVLGWVVGMHSWLQGVNKGLSSKYAEGQIYFCHTLLPELF